jgi:hypothetical protein
MPFDLGPGRHRAPLRPGAPTAVVSMQSKQPRRRDGLMIAAPASIIWAAVATPVDLEMIETIVRQSLLDLDQAVKEKNERLYAEAYGRLTEACNGCHQAARRGFVVIQDPKDAIFADQDFRPRP